MMTRVTLTLCVAAALLGVRPVAQTSPGAGPVIVLETAKGTIEFETYPDEAPKTSDPDQLRSVGGCHS